MSYDSTILADSPVAYWPLNETSGSVVTDSASTHNGTYSNISLNQGSIYNLDNSISSVGGSTSIISVPTSTALEITGSVTVECWVKTNASTIQEIVTKPYTSLTNPYFDYCLSCGRNTSNFAFFVSVGTTLYQVNSNATHATGKWYHVVGVYNGSNISIYINGVLDCTPVSVTGSLRNDAQSLAIASAGSWTSDNLNGSVSSVAIYNSALTASKIRAHFEAGASGTKPSRSTYDNIVVLDSPVSYYPLNETSGALCYDQMGNNNGSYTGNFTLAQTGPNTFITLSSLFSGTSGYVVIPDSTSLTPTDFTIEAWVKTSSASSFQPVFVKYPSSSPFAGYGLAVKDGQVATLGATGNWLQSGATINDGSWHYIACKKSGTTYSIYKDGSSITSSTISASISNSSPAYIGASSLSQYFPGNIAAVAFYNTVLSDTQLSNHYNDVITKRARRVQFEGFSSINSFSGGMN